MTGKARNAPLGSVLSRWLLLGTVLGGLLLMHGLSVHGSHGSAPVAQVEAAAMHTTSATDLVGVPHPAGSMEILCLTVLPVSFLLLLRRTTRRRTRLHERQATLARVPAAAARSPDPPTPLLLSISRC